MHFLFFDIWVPFANSSSIHSFKANAYFYSNVNWKNYFKLAKQQMYLRLLNVGCLGNDTGVNAKDAKILVESSLFASSQCRAERFRDN